MIIELICESGGRAEPQYGRAANEGATLYELSALHMSPGKQYVLEKTMRRASG
jgi:hypothetical protein